MSKQPKDGTYYVVQSWMVNELQLKGSALSTFAIIYGFSQDGESEFTGSIAYLCGWLGCSRPTASKALEDLCKAELLIKSSETRNGVIFNTYKVNLPLVKKLCRGSKETLQGSKEILQGGSKETLHNNSILDKDRDKDRDNIEKKKADDLPIVSAESLTLEFEKLWELYPKKQGKSNALRDYIKARKDKKQPVAAEEVQEGIERYIAYIKAQGIEQRFIKQGSTWFHQRCWEDDYGRGVINGRHTGDYAEARIGNYV